MQESLDDIAKFGKMVKLVSFVPFKDAAHALEVANDVSEGELDFSVCLPYALSAALTPLAVHSTLPTPLPTFKPPFHSIQRAGEIFYRLDLQTTKQLN